jgi:hypothetical protein
MLQAEAHFENANISHTVKNPQLHREAQSETDHATYPRLLPLYRENSAYCLASCLVSYHVVSQEVKVSARLLLCCFVELICNSLLIS